MVSLPVCSPLLPSVSRRRGSTATTRPLRGLGRHGEVFGEKIYRSLSNKKRCLERSALETSDFPQTFNPDSLLLEAVGEGNAQKVAMAIENGALVDMVDQVPGLQCFRLYFFWGSSG